MESITLIDALTIFALIAGPIVAVLITRWTDDRRERKNRRMEIFRTLMRTRRTPMVPEHVGALNLIEFEFSRDGVVMQAWRRLFDHFGTAHPQRDDEQILPGMSDQEQGERRRRFIQRLAEERQRLLLRLLHAMATALNFPVQQLEIFEGGYTPQGWNDVEAEQAAIRRLFVEMYLGLRRLPLSVYDYTRVQSEPESVAAPDSAAKAEAQPIPLRQPLCRLSQPRARSVTLRCGFVLDGPSFGPTPFLASLMGLRTLEMRSGL